MEYIDYCQEAGWYFVCNKEKIHIFVTADQNAIPIETDENLKYQAIKKGTLKQYALQWFVLPLILLFNSGIQYFHNYELFIASTLSILTLVILIFFFIILGSQIISFCIWCKRAKRNLANGKTLPSYNQNDLKRRSKIRILLVVLALVIAISVGIVSFINSDYFSGWLLFIMVGVTALTWGVTNWYQKKKLDRASNIVLPVVLGLSIAGVFMFSSIAFTIASSHENPKVYVEGNTFSIVGRSEIPLKLEDLGIVPQKYRDTNKNSYKSVFAKYIIYEDTTSNQIGSDDKSVKYCIFESNYDFIINHYVNYQMGKSYENYKPSDASIWNTRKVFYSDKTHSYMVIYKHCVLIVGSDLTLNENALTTVKEKLNIKQYMDSPTPANAR